MSPANRFFRAVGMFLGNVVTAIMGSTFFTSEIYRVFPTTTPWGALRKETILSALAAFGLGYFVYYKWRPASSKWIFVAGLTWLGWGALTFWLGERNLRVVSADRSIYWDLSGTGCNDFDGQSCLDYINYTLVSLRTIFYSAGAFCCSRLGTPSFQGIGKALPTPMTPVDLAAATAAIDDPSDSQGDGRLSNGSEEPE